MLKKEKNVFIIQNTELGSYLPLSVYLTELLNSSFLLQKENISLIISKSNKIPTGLKNKAKNIFQISSNLYSIKGNIKFTLNALGILIKENKKCKINIVHCLYPNSSLLSAVIFKLLINKRVKIIYDVRSPWIEMSFKRKHIKNFFSPIFKAVMHLEEFLLIRLVDYFVFITDGLKKYYEKKYKLKNLKYKIIPSGVNTELFKYSYNDNIRKKLNIKDNDIVLGIVSTLGKERGYDFIINAFKKIDSTQNKYRLVFVGDGPDKKYLESISRKLGISKNVIFTGKIDHEMVPEYISSFDIGICHLPDIFVFRQSFPLKILEYLSCSIPVIASDINAHREISGSLNDIALYENEEEFIKLLPDVKKQALENNARTLLKLKYDWVSLGEIYEGIYGKIT